MFCPKCGEKNKEGANFCVKCGEKFTNKASKSKSSKSSKITSDDVKEYTKEVTKEMGNKASDIIRDMIAKPYDALKKHGVEENFNLSLCLTGIMSILTGLFIISVIKNTFNGVYNSFSKIVGYNSFDYAPVSSSVPYFKYFIFGIIITFILSFIFVGVLYLVNNLLFKGKESFKKMYVIYSIISIIVSCTLLISIVLSFISVSFSAVFVALGLSLSSYYVFLMIRLIGPKDENKHGYLYVLTSGIFYLVVYILVKMFM